MEKLKFVPADTVSSKVVDYVAEDGHRMKSRNAFLVDNWLYDHDVAHSFETEIPTLKLKSDFYLKNSDCYIEVFSERNNDGLNDKMTIVNYFLKIKARFIEIFLNDIDTIDKSMREKLMKLGIDFKKK